MTRNEVQSDSGIRYSGIREWNHSGIIEYIGTIILVLVNNCENAVFDTVRPLGTSFRHHGLNFLHIL